jgi:myo-inositol-1(or 4)-monophosphatase
VSAGGPPAAGGPDLHELLALAESAAREAGALVRDERPRDLGVAATKSTPTDPVTVMDQRSERLLHERLLGARPDDGLLGEEGAAVAGTSGITWVVDPIDGTVNYLYNIPAYAVSVAAVTGDPRVPGGYDVLVGCVHNPVTGDTWTAVRGGGAFLDGERLAVRDVDDLGQVLLATGFGYAPQRRAHQASVVSALLPQVRDIRRIGSGTLDLCGVAAGRVDAYVERGLSPWDLAAGELVAREAGALVTGLATDDGAAPAGADLVVVAAPGLHARLQELLRPLRPDTDGP